MNIMSITRLTLIAAIAGGWAGAWANSYTVIDLGQHVNPVGISGAGDVAGNTTPPLVRAQLFHGGRWHNLTAHSQVFGINKHANSVGVNWNALTPLFWPRHGDVVVMKMPHREKVAWPRAINEHNVAIGWFWLDNGGGPTHCFTWSPDAGSTDIGLMEGGRSATPSRLTPWGRLPDLPRRI